MARDRLYLSFATSVVPSGHFEIHVGIGELGFWKAAEMYQLCDAHIMIGSTH
jgi:hypothetical protein